LDLGLKVKTVPYINQWINNESINLNQIKELNIEELLSRSPIKIDNPVIKNDIHNKVVMITGAAGSIGSEIATQVILYKPKQLILIDQAESALYDIQQDFLRKSYDNFIAIVADIRDKNIMAEYFSTYKPEVIYHAAAYKHVPLMEENPYEAIKVNVFGSKNLMDLAVANNVHKFVMISTDKAVNPTNVMGATKRAAEIYATCLQAHISTTKFIITRFGNVLGSNGSVIKLFQKQLKQGGPLTVTHKKITRFFMTIPEACNLVLEAGTMGDGGEIFVFDMGEPVRIYDLAVKMIQLSGYHYPEDIEIKITGLRSGEKLYEEVLGNDEGDLPTYHEKVKIAALKEVDCQEFLTKLKDLEHYKKMSNFEIVKILKEMIPEFISNNSIYSKLDQN
jgi:FlaA1/EpsC-like NDP-sugar epimerase